MAGGERNVTVSDTDGHGTSAESLELEAEPHDEPLAQGSRVDRYVIVAPIGRGGFGVVYEANDPDLDRRVAIKVLHPERSRGLLAQERLLREAQALARLSHPNVVTVHDVGALGHGLFVAMELVDGETLGAWLQAGPRSLDQILDAFDAAGRGLAAAHSAGIVHRDFKPANVLVGRNGQVRVADFGLARSQDDSDSGSGVPLALGSSRPEVTRAGTVLGTPAYMAPEQQRGERVDARSDQYSFAAALHEALEGKRPGADGSTSLRADQPAWLRRLIQRALAPRREDRYADMDALLDDLVRGRGARRRRRLVGAAVVAAVAVAAGVAALAARGGASGPAPCTGFDARLGGVWDGARRERMHAAFAGTGAVYAQDAFTHASARLDDYAHDWVDMRRDACLATRVRGEQSEALLDLRMACLDRRLAQLGELTSIFAAADHDVVEGAVRAVTRLDPLSGCADAAALTARLPPPADATLAPRIAATRARLDRAQALGDAGKYDDALAIARPAEADARAIAWPALTAEALYLRGNLERLADGNAAAADAPLAEAARQAALAHDDTLQARALITLAFRAGEAGDHTRALALIDAADSVVTRAGGDELLRADWRATQASVFERLGRYDEARVAYAEALAVRERRLGRDAPDVAVTLNNFSNVARAQGKLDEVRVQLTRSLAIWKQAYGPDHPNVAITLNNLGSLELDAGHLVDAERDYSQALALKQKLYGADNLSVAITLMNLGNIASMRGRLDEADGYLTRALAIRRAQLGEDNAFVLESQYNLAILRRQQGRYDEALALHRQVLAGRERLFGPVHDKVANSIDAIAAVLEQQGKLPEALAERRRALAMREKVFGPDHLDVAGSLAGVAGVLETLGRCGEAEPAAQRALAIVDAQHLGESYDALAPLETLGLCELRRGHGAAATAHLERAVVTGEKAGASPADVAGMRFELARALWQDGRDRARARREAERAHADLGGASAAVEVATWLAAHPGP